MRIIADTNVLARALTDDDPLQSPLAQAALAEAEVVVIPTTALREIVWLLSRGYGVARAAIANAIRKLLDADNAVFDVASAEAGLAMLESGGDFADAVIAYEGRRLGGETFVSFDKDAVRRLQEGGFAAVTPH
jgi:predicted nucleic-acid-binding protein